MKIYDNGADDNERKRYTAQQNTMLRWWTKIVKTVCVRVIQPSFFSFIIQLRMTEIAIESTRHKGNHLKSVWDGKDYITIAFILPLLLLLLLIRYGCFIYANVMLCSAIFFHSVRWFRIQKKENILCMYYSEWKHIHRVEHSAYTSYEQRLAH